MVKKPSDKTPRDLLKPAAFVFMMGVLLWIGLDLYLAARARQTIANDVNEAIALSDNGAYVAAIYRLHQTQEHRQRLRNRTAHFWMEKLRPFDARMKRRLASLHRAVAIGFTEQQLPALAEQHYTLALLHDPEITGIARRLPMECFYTGNYELGWIATRMARNDPESRIPGRLAAFFESNYEGPRYAIGEERGGR